MNKFYHLSPPSSYHVTMTTCVWNFELSLGLKLRKILQLLRLFSFYWFFSCKFFSPGFYSQSYKSESSIEYSSVRECIKRKAFYFLGVIVFWGGLFVCFVPMKFSYGGFVVRYLVVALLWFRELSYDIMPPPLLYFLFIPRSCFLYSEVSEAVLGDIYIEPHLNFLWIQNPCFPIQNEVSFSVFHASWKA